MITMQQLVGVDAGGTSTRAAVVRADGTCLGIGRGGRGNPVSDGAEAAGASIATAVGGALAAAGVAGETVRRTSVAMAGGTISESPEWLRRPLRTVGLEGAVAIEPDLLAMFCSGTPALAGYGLVAGTGATAVRVVDAEMVGMADGLGWLLGDVGSGFWIGQRVARAVAHALSARPPATTLVGPALEALGIDADTRRLDGPTAPALTSLVRTVYGSSPLSLARLAPLAFLDPADEVSCRIVDDAIDGLADTLLAVTEPGLDGPVVIGGGVANSQQRLADGVIAALAGRGLTPQVHLAHDGLVGACIVALRRAGITVDQPVFENLHASVADQRRRAGG